MKRRMSAYKIDTFAVDHPSGQDRVFDLNDMVDASPYREVQDSPEVAAHLPDGAGQAGRLHPAGEGGAEPLSGIATPPNRRAMPVPWSICASPIFQKALAEINSLIEDEPNNPYFYEVRGQIYMSMAKPAQAIPDYQKSVNLRPRAPQLRLALATAQLATDDPALAAPALDNLKAAILVGERRSSSPGTRPPRPTACSRTSRWRTWPPPSSGTMPATCKKALVFATRARGKLPQGSAGLAAGQRHRRCRGAAGAHNSGEQSMRRLG